MEPARALTASAPHPTATRRAVRPLWSRTREFIRRRHHRLFADGGRFAREAILTGADWGSGVVGLVGGLFLTAMGLAVWRLTYEFSLRHLELYEYGFVFILGTARHPVLWDDVCEVQEFVVRERPPILLPPASLLVTRFVSRRYVVITRDGQKFIFTRNTVGPLKFVAEIFKQELIRRYVRWTVIDED